MKIQPIDDLSSDEPNKIQVYRPVVRSLLKRLFERPFQRISATEKLSIAVIPSFHKDGTNNFSDGGEPSSVCLAKMVQNFLEENSDKQSSSAARCGRNRCHCFNGRSSDHSSEDESDNRSGESNEILRKLAPCPSVEEKNLLADISRMVDKNKNCRRKDYLCWNIVAAGLLALGYDAAVCKSHWDKCTSHIAGEYEYIDVIISGERLLVDIDFRSEFEIARSTKAYKSLLLTLPYIFVGKADRLQKIVAVVSDAAKRSLKKKGMHIPPWRKFEYVKAKWLAAYTRTPSVTPLPDSNHTLDQMDSAAGEENKLILLSEWKPPAVEPKPSLVEVRVLAGLASVVEGC